MLVSSATNDYSTSTRPSSSASQSLRVRIRTLNVCEPSFPSRDVVRQENYARRKAQEFQGWTCPRTIPYQDIGPAHVPPRTPKPIINERTTNATSAKPALRQASSENVSNRRKSNIVVQDESLMRAQFEENFQRLQTAHKEHLKKSSYILRHVQLGRGLKEIVEKYTPDSSRMKSADINGLPSVKGDEKEQNVSHDRLRDDFDEEDDDIEVSTVSGIRDDIMSPRTTIETSGSNKHHPVEMSIIPMKLSQSAPPMKRNKIPQETLRLFTPYYTDLSETLHLEEKKLIRDKLYRQLCCILWLLRRMSRPEWQESISGCWNIAQWRTTDPGPHANHHNQPVKKTQESIKTDRKRTPRSEDKSVSTTKTPKENTIPPIRTTSVPVHKSRKKPNSTNESSMTHLRRTSLDSQSGSNTLGDATERLDLTINSVNIDSDLNESISSTTDSTNLYSIQQSINPPLTTTNSIDPTTNTSRTSLSSNFSQPIGHKVSARLTAIMERQQQRRSPDMLLKKWIKRQTITTNNSDQPLAEKELRLLRVGDMSDLNRIFGLENATSTNKEQVRVRETREIERKLVTDVKRRPATSVGFSQAKLHAQVLYKIRRDFNEFNEEQSTILNNKLEQADNSRMFYYQTKLDLVQKTMLPKTKSSEKDKPVVIIDRLFRKMRFDKAKKEENAVYLKYQPWYVDLSKMIQKEYKDDYIIILLLNEIEKFSDPLHKPTDIRFKAILRKLKVHEVCHPDIMAAIQFIRVHVMRMKKGELKRFFRKQFPTVTIYVKKSSDNDDDDDSEDDDDSDETICEP